MRLALQFIKHKKTVVIDTWPSRSQKQPGPTSRQTQEKKMRPDNIPDIQRRAQSMDSRNKEHRLDETNIVL
ncbi:hypothetical protein B0J17DRAFT_421184 [Rhizoctonia solani]|nr:hypothetical protein B0J17DRAFT_421184 [Rhizoctonia solani]